MTELRTVEQPCNIKINDSGTKIQFYATDDNGRISFTENDTLIFKIKNSMGYVTETQGSSASGGYIVELNSADLSVLTPDTYFIELWVTKNGNTVIYPDKAFCPIAVTQNVLSISGDVLPTTSLDSMQKTLQQFVTDETASIHNDFDSYVADIKTGPKGEQGIQGEPGPIGEQGPQGDAGTIKIGTVSSTSETASVTNVGTDSNAILNFNLPKGEQGPQGIQGEQGPIGEQGPQGTLGDYCVSTGWQNLNPYMNADVFQGYGGDTTLGKNFYAVTSINGVNIFWFRLDTAIKDATLVNTWGTKLFDIPSDVVSQYKSLGMTISQYNTMLEVTGVPVICQIAGDQPYLQIRGWLPVINNGNQASMPTGNARVVHYTGWILL